MPLSSSNTQVTCFPTQPSKISLSGEPLLAFLIRSLFFMQRAGGEAPSIPRVGPRPIAMRGKLPVFDSQPPIAQR